MSEDNGFASKRQHPIFDSFLQVQNPTNLVRAQCDRDDMLFRDQKDMPEVGGTRTVELCSEVLLLRCSPPGKAPTHCSASRNCMPAVAIGADRILCDVSAHFPGLEYVNLFQVNMYSHGITWLEIRVSANADGEIRACLTA